MKDGDKIEYKGRTFIVQIHHDNDMEAPWCNSDGHGKVTEGYRSKCAGEWVMRGDHHSYAHSYFYDHKGAMEKARKEGWGVSEEAVEELRKKLGREPTAGQIAEEAVRRDFEYLKGWLKEDWWYVGVSVRHISKKEDDFSHALWGIESNSGDDYLKEVAEELAREITYEIEKEVSACRQEIHTAKTTKENLLAEAESLPKELVTHRKVAEGKLKDLEVSVKLMEDRIKELETEV